MYAASMSGPRVWINRLCDGRDHIQVHGMPGPHRIVEGLRRGGRWCDVEHGRIRGRDCAPVGAGEERRGAAVRAAGEVAHRGLQPDQPLHPLSRQGCGSARHPGRSIVSCPRLSLLVRSFFCVVNPLESLTFSSEHGFVWGAIVLTFLLI